MSDLEETERYSLRLSNYIIYMTTILISFFFLQKIALQFSVVDKIKNPCLLNLIRDHIFQFGRIWRGGGMRIRIGQHEIEEILIYSYKFFLKGYVYAIKKNY